MGSDRPRQEGPVWIRTGQRHKPERHAHLARGEYLGGAFTEALAETGPGRRLGYIAMASEGL
jgi:hypothetical protein